MTSERANDEQMTKAILVRVVEDELEGLPANEMPQLPQPEPLCANDEVLVDQFGEMIRIVGDAFNKMYGNEMKDKTDGIAKEIINNPSKKGIYLMRLVKKVFADDVINWGRIATLIYATAMIAKKVYSSPGAVIDMISWTLGYFKENLLGWVIKMGGWLCSFAALARYRIETVPTLCPPKPTSDHAIAITYFVGGIVIGSCIVLWLSGKTKH